MYLASTPAKPVSAPTSDPLVTNTEQIRVDYLAVADDGGLPLLSYEL
jgi:hypothetical protein